MPNVSANDLTALAGYIEDQERFESWRTEAACTDDYAESVWFFPDQADQFVGARGIRRARLYCARCPVRAPCLTLALEQNWSGVWGGTTDEMRAGVAHLDPSERVGTLDAQFEQLATRGPWRVVGRDEFRGRDGAREHRDQVRPQEVSRNGRHEPARSQGSGAR